MLVEFLQLLVNGLVQSAVFALLAVGFTLIFGVTRTFHLAHGGVYVWAGYTGYFFYQQLALPLWLSILLACCATMLIGWLIEALVYRPLRSIDSGTQLSKELVGLVTSLALLILMQNFAQILWGSGGLSLGSFNYTPFNFGGVTVAPLDMVNGILAIGLITSLSVFLRRSVAGQSLLAAMDDPMTAEVLGVNINKTYVIAMVLGSLLVVPPAIIYGIEYQLLPDSGTYLALTAFAAALLGGLGSVRGAVAGSIVLGIASALTVSFTSSRWTTTVVFGILLVIVIIRPAGIFGRRAQQRV